jgi:hypothetical protein
LLKQNQILSSQPFNKQLAVKLMNKADLAAGRPESFENDSHDEKQKKELELLEQEICEAEKIIQAKKKKIVNLLQNKVVQQTA